MAQSMRFYISLGVEFEPVARETLAETKSSYFFRIREILKGQNTQTRKTRGPDHHRQPAQVNGFGRRGHPEHASHLSWFPSLVFGTFSCKTLINRSENPVGRRDFERSVSGDLVCDRGTGTYLPCASFLCLWRKRAIRSFS